MFGNPNIGILGTWEGKAFFWSSGSSCGGTVSSSLLRGWFYGHFPCPPGSRFKDVAMIYDGYPVGFSFTYFASI